MSTLYPAGSDRYRPTPKPERITFGNLIAAFMLAYLLN
jgi:hypothetical protein